MLSFSRRSTKPEKAKVNTRNRLTGSLRLIFASYLNPFICVHHCHYHRDLGEERYQLRPTFFSPYSRKRNQIAALCWFFTFRTVSNCDRGKPRARNNKLCHVFYSNNQFACTACDAWTTKYVSKAIGLRLERMKLKETWSHEQFQAISAVQ